MVSLPLFRGISSTGQCVSPCPAIAPWSVSPERDPGGKRDDQSQTLSSERQARADRRGATRGPGSPPLGCHPAHLLSKTGSKQILSPSRLFLFPCAGVTSHAPAPTPAPARSAAGTAWLGVAHLQGPVQRQEASSEGRRHKACSFSPAASREPLSFPVCALAGKAKLESCTEARVPVRPCARQCDGGVSRSRQNLCVSQRGRLAAPAPLQGPRNQTHPTVLGHAWVPVRHREGAKPSGACDDHTWLVLHVKEALVWRTRGPWGGRRAPARSLRCLHVLLWS